MIERFLNYFGLNKRFIYSGDLYKDLIDQYGGITLGKGLFSLFKEDDINKWNNIVKETYTDFPSQVRVFGYDWLGRCFGIDQRKKTEGSILRYEVGTADIIEIPRTLEEFINIEIPCFSEDCLSKSYFDEWSEYSGIQLNYSECAGYKVPLFLNGDDIKKIWN